MTNIISLDLARAAKARRTMRHPAAPPLNAWLSDRHLQAMSPAGEECQVVSFDANPGLLERVLEAVQRVTPDYRSPQTATDTPLPRLHPKET